MDPEKFTFEWSEGHSRNRREIKITRIKWKLKCNLQEPWGTTKAVPRGNFIATGAHIKNIREGTD
jgi:hypothetical protein